MNPMQGSVENMQERRPSFVQTDRLKPSQDIAEYLRAYARERPEVVALWCFGIGFILGWKLKPW